MTLYRDAPGAPNVLICAGLDPSGGAGLIADVRIASTVGVRPIGVVTALTVQSTLGVQDKRAVEGELIGAQLAALLGDIEVAAVKLGMLGSSEVIREVAYGLDLTAAPVVWDPVAAPSRGRVDFDGALLEEAVAQLARHLTLITPNLGELALLTGSAVEHRAGVIAAAQRLAERTGAAVLVKGGHATGDADDVLVADANAEPLVLPGARIPGGEDVHGTGCALSTAIAAYLARGLALADACREAKALVARHIATAVRPGRGAAAIV